MEKRERKRQRKKEREKGEKGREEKGEEFIIRRLKVLRERRTIPQQFSPINVYAFNKYLLSDLYVPGANAPVGPGERALEVKD